MHGLVSFLPEPYYQQVKDIWQKLEEECGLQGIKVTPYPHFSWQIAQDYDLDLLQTIMSKVAQQASTIPVQTAGIGLFTGPRPVIYIRVVKSTELMNFHAHLWELTQPAGKGISPFYSPESWMPHISLAYEDVDASNIAPIIEMLAFQNYTWKMIVDNISLIYEPFGAIGVLKYQHKLAARERS
jgi:2'-5' RNA ligase